MRPATAAGTGAGDVLDLVRRGVASTRTQVQAVTGLSRVTVAQRIDALLAHGLLRAEGSAASTGGRRPAVLRFNAERSVVLSASIDTSHSRVAVADLEGKVLRESPISLDIGRGPESVLTTLEEALARELTAVGEVEVEGVGISLPAPVDPATGRPSEPPIMPGWDGYPIADHIQAAFEVPVVVENDANAMAIGEHATHYRDTSAFCLLKVSAGIGAGIVLDGRLFAGNDGGAGDIGHVRLPGVERLRRCGSRGCLAAVASGRAVAETLREEGRPITSEQEVVASLLAGDGPTTALVREAGRRIGEVMATVVCLLNPGVLVVAGDLASTALVSGLREGLYPLALPRATRHLRIELSRLQQQASTIGLTHLVVDRTLSPAAVDERLRATPGPALE